MPSSCANTAMRRYSDRAVGDGPFPEHYEPLECPVEKNFMNAQLHEPHGPGLRD